MKKLLFATLLMAITAAHGKTVKVQVIDDLDQPVSGADISVWFWSIKNSFDDEKRYKSDASGRIVARGETTVGYSIQVNKSGYYGAKSEPYIAPIELVERTYVLPKILEPVQLYANRFDRGSGRTLKVPMQGVWLGYDFEFADWVAPHGQGKAADIQFRFRNEFRGWRMNEQKMKDARRVNSDKSADEIRFFYGKYDGTLEISFPGPEEGLMEEENRYLPYSELKLPHLAPEGGYQPTRRYEANTYLPRSEDRDVGFFLRTRVKLDEEGNIVSANYSKIYGDIYFDARGSISMWYYFNPVPNDRNLEFDPERNLLPENRPGSEVRNP